MSKANSLFVVSTPRAGSSAFGKLLSESGFSQPPFLSVLNQSESEFNKYGYFEDAELNLCLDNLIRFAFDSSNSFIYNSGMMPDRTAMLKNLSERCLLEYDLDDLEVEVPNDYEQNLEKYTGHDWDVWGLTRMQTGKKWHLAHSRAGVENPKKALEKLQKVFSYLGNVNSTFIKDPRLIYLLPIIDVPIRGVAIRRNPDEILKSMRNHYGPNLFTKEILHGGWVSNHFNYKILPQTFDEYFDVYQSFERYAGENFNMEFIEYEKLYDLTYLERLSTRLGSKLAWKVEE